ncbi:type II toxin-antitoxin system Phd/YefM family antitoxin [Butyrivibrio sp. VCB2006]|uniref:type II toxin-antitoxin system Phd/YefM family antitoxin n=1 Tax=Butyrivibrio sp. VCB2006 TaxID=1280679 RepID=UPI000402E512|nr:type II toxin-antitoxin system Phd/YefM family antitoxin [Butyrivibrio sp. VCB2006]
MTVDTSIMVSITEANRNFSKVAKLVEEKGAALILKNNTPCFLITDIRKTDENSEASDEDVLAISQKLMAQNKEAYEVLAK